MFKTIMFGCKLSPEGKMCTRALCKQSHSNNIIIKISLSLHGGSAGNLTNKSECVTLPAQNDNNKTRPPMNSALTA